MSVQEAAVSLLEKVLFYVGIDWGTERHAVCVLGPSGRVKTQFTIEHTAAGFAQLLRRLAELTADPADLAVAIERPDGRLVDAVLEAGHPVVPVSPNAIRTWRRGEVLSGAKSDAGDAVLIAEYLRLRAHRLQPATPYSAQTKALRTVVRTREDVQNLRIAAVNQLGALLDAHWPGAKVIFTDIESIIGLAFLTRYPTYVSAERLTETRLQAFSVKHRYSGRRPAAELLARLRTAPAGTTDTTLNGAVRDAVLAQVAVLNALTATEKALGQSVVAHLEQHPDAAIFTSLPRSGQISATQVLAEWGDSRAAYDPPDAVAALAGVTPVTKESGKHRAVHFRWACNKHFRNAITRFADNSRHANPWAAQVYTKAIDCGHDHPHAVRILARAWIKSHLPLLERRQTLTTPPNTATPTSSIRPRQPDRTAGAYWMISTGHRPLRGSIENPVAHSKQRPSGAAPGNRRLWLNWRSASGIEVTDRAKSSGRTCSEG